METNIFEDYLNQADAAARQGDWQAALEALKRASEVDPEHTGVLNGIGTSLIQLEQPEQAVPYFQRVAALAPGSAEAHNNLGVVYSLTGQVEAARMAYQKAIQIDPDHAQAWKNLALVHLKQGQAGEGARILAAVVQANPRDPEALYLLAQCYEEVQDYPSARTLYEEALKHQPDLQPARQALERLQAAAFERLPAPVQDPARIARPEHAKKLASLKSLKGLRLNGAGRVQSPDTSSSSSTTAGRSTSSRSSSSCTAGQPTVAFYGPPEAAVELRLGPVVQELASRDVPVKVTAQFDPADLANFETFVFSRPQASPSLMEALDHCASSGKRILLDLDDDFHHLPEDHLAASRLNSAEALRALEAALAQAEIVTVPSAGLAERVRPFARRVEVIPTGWSRSSVLWDKPSPRRGTVNVGLLGAHLLPQDLKVLKNDLTRLVRQEPQVLLVVAQDYRLYQAFASISEDRRMFLPAGRMEDYPYLLASFDILLVPQQDSSYNQIRSNAPLMEAGIRRIPWVASPLPIFKEWGAGGLFAEKKGEWLTALKQLVQAADLRQELGEAGRLKAETREMGVLVSRWLELL